MKIGVKLFEDHGRGAVERRAIYQSSVELFLGRRISAFIYFTSSSHWECTILLTKILFICMYLQGDSHRPGL